MVGYQTLWLGAFAKIHGWTSGLLPAATFSSRLFKVINLERGLIAGGVMLAVGVLLNLYLVVSWFGHDLGALEVTSTLRYALWGLTFVVLGVQTIFGSFFLSMLGMTSDQKRRRAAHIRI
jgi:hypothetical protein